MTNKILTTAIAAEMLGTSERRVRQLITELNISYTTVGRAIILTPADVKKMQGRKTQRGPEKKAIKK